MTKNGIVNMVLLYTIHLEDSILILNSQSLVLAALCRASLLRFSVVENIWERLFIGNPLGIWTR